MAKEFHPAREIMKVTITHMPTKKSKKRGPYGQNGSGLDCEDDMRDVANIRLEWILQCCSDEVRAS